MPVNIRKSYIGAANQSQTIERQKTLASITMINDLRQNHRPRNI